MTTTDFQSWAAAGQARIEAFLQKALPSLDIAPTNSLLRNPHGHRVDRSDVGVLLAEIVALREGGQVSPLDDAEVSGRPAIGLDITGPADGAARRVQRYKLWLARDTLFPLRVDSFAADGSLIESVDMSDAQLDVRFPPRFFTP